MKAHTHITSSTNHRAFHAMHAVRALHTAPTTSALYQYYLSYHQDSYTDV